MDVSPIMFLFIMATNTMLAVVLVAIGLSYSRLVRKLHKSEEENLTLHQDMQDKTVMLLDEARTRAVKIIEDANTKAQQIISGSQELDQTAKEAIIEQLKELAKEESQTFGKSSQDISKTYEMMLAKMREEHINMLKSISKDIESQALTEVEGFKTTLAQGTIGSQKMLEQRIAQEYTALQNQLVEYKQVRLKKIDQSIYQLIQTVCVEVIGKTMTLEDHQKLVTDVLTQAKNDLMVTLDLENQQAEQVK